MAGRKTENVDKAIGSAMGSPSPEQRSLSGAAVLSEKGYTGLKQFSGTVNEEFLKEMQGEKGMRLLTEMRDNHPIIGGFMHAIDMLIRGVSWSVEAASPRPEDVEAANLVSSCLDDMEFSWQDTLSEMLSFTTYGWAFHEICYKRRQGQSPIEPAMRSRFNDNKIGWAKLPGRAQDTLYRWDMDAHGTVQGMWQHIYQTDVASVTNFEAYIPAEKAIMLRTRSYKNNPQGRSILRNCVTSYLAQRKIEEIERIGIERDLAGLPIIYAPASIMQPTADDNEKKVYNTLLEGVRKVKRDQTEGLVLPSDCYLDANGQPTGVKMFEMVLLSTGGTRQFDTTVILQRLDNRIAMTVLADFIMLGHDNRGTYSLGVSKVDMFTSALLAMLDVIKEAFNRQAIPRLLRLNGYNLLETPTLQHAGLDQIDLTEVAAYIRDLSAAGMPLFPDPALEDYLRDLGDLPAPSSDGGGAPVGEGGGTRMNSLQTAPPPVAGNQPDPLPNDNSGVK